MWGCGSGRRIERRSEATPEGGSYMLRSKKMWVQSNKKEWKAKQERKEKMRNIGGDGKLRVVWDEGKQRSDWARWRSGEWSICYWRIQIGLRTLCTVLVLVEWWWILCSVLAIHISSILRSTFYILFLCLSSMSMHCGNSIHGCPDSIECSGSRQGLHRRPLYIRRLLEFLRTEQNVYNCTILQLY